MQTTSSGGDQQRKKDDKASSLLQCSHLNCWLFPLHLLVSIIPFFMGVLATMVIWPRLVYAEPQNWNESPHAMWGFGKGCVSPFSGFTFFFQKLAGSQRRCADPSYILKQSQCTVYKLQMVRRRFCNWEEVDELVALFLVVVETRFDSNAVVVSVMLRTCTI